jgi:hypothetical protein
MSIRTFKLQKCFVEVETKIVSKLYQNLVGVANSLWLRTTKIETEA